MVAVPYFLVDGGVRFDSLRFPVAVVVILVPVAGGGGVDSPITRCESSVAIFREGFLLGLGLGERERTAEARRGFTMPPSEARGISSLGTRRCTADGVLGAEDTFSGV